MSEEQEITKIVRKKVDFSIEGILREPYSPKFIEDSEAKLEETVVDGGSEGCELLSEETKGENSGDVKNYSWLYCSRFKPPKLPRSKKRSNRKRYGRGPRIPFAAHQIAVLENAFSKSHYLSPDCIARLADSLLLNETRVKIWFQNRRARFRREQELMNMSSDQQKNPADPNSHRFSDHGDSGDHSPGDGKYKSQRSVTSDFGSIRVIDSPVQLSSESYHALPKYPSSSISSSAAYPDFVKLTTTGPLDHSLARFSAPFYNRIVLGGSCSAFVPLFRR